MKIIFESNKRTYSKLFLSSSMMQPSFPTSIESMARSPLVDLANVASFGQYIKDATLLSFYNRTPWHGSL
jgi:hypothetical protein